MFIRSKQVKEATYYQVVEGFRDEAGRVRHRSIVSLGRHATVDDATAAARKQLRVVERQETAERESCPPSSYRPPSSARRLAELERKREQLVERIDTLACARNALAQQHTRARLTQQECEGAFAALVTQIAERTGRSPWHLTHLPVRQLKKLAQLSGAELCQKLTRSEPGSDGEAVVTV